MKLVKSNYRKKGLILLLLSFGMIFASIGFSSLNFSLNFTSINEETNLENDFDYQYQTPKTSEYQNFDGSGEQLNITLHQSLINTTEIEFLNLDNSNTFQEPSPTFQGFNTSNIDIDVDVINAPNKTILYEDATSARIINAVNGHYISFKARGVGYLENLSIYLNRTSIFLTRLSVYLYNSELDGSIAKPYNLVYASPIVDLSTITGNTPHWHNMTDIHSLFNCSETYDDTFYLYLEKIGASTDIEIYGELTTLGGDGTHDNHVLDNSEFEFNIAGSLVDAAVEIDFVPLNNTPKPSQIDLEINNLAVDDVDFQEGKYSVNEGILTDLSGTMDFDVSADWWDVSCNISNVQINYTKNDVKANTDFRILSSGDDVQWNVTIPSGLNYFDTRITDFNIINFTIPAIWLNPTIEVFNGSTDKTSDSFSRLLNEDYREVQVLNAGNGTYWHLTANSTNLFNSIDTFVGGLARIMVNRSNTVEINTTFIEPIFDGILNLSIFTPIQGYLNHTRNLNLTPLASSDEFHVSDWDISVNVTEYGVFKIQASWNNDTTAGFLEDTITVIADTSLTLQPYPLKYTFYSGDTFNLTAYYEDTGLNQGIEADSITYQIGTGSVRDASSFYIGGGYYNITIDANDVDFNYGPNTIVVNVEKTYYNNQTSSEIITILAETDAYIAYPVMNDVFDSGDTFDLELYYNDTVQDTGITGAIIEYSLGGAPFRSDAAITDFANGYYNITISASDANFSGYGFKTIDVNINMDYHYNHSESITIKLLGETAPIAAARVPDKAYYTAAETFNISLYYEDSIKSIGVSGATIVIDIGGTTHIPLSMFDYGDGNYEITIDCSDSDFDSYGYFPIRVNVNLTNYYNQTDTLNTLIVGNESLTVLAPNSGAVYIAGQNFDIAVEYNDTILNNGIDGATIEYSLDGGSTYKSTNVTPLGSGQYNITIDVSDSDFISFGFVDIYIDASKHFYENRSTTYTFHRQITTEIAPSNIVDLGSVLKGLNVTYTFNYSDTTGKPIAQSIWSPIGAYYGFQAFLQNLGDGNYTIHLDSTNVGVAGSPYTIFFNVSSTGNETQIIQLTIDVLIIQTEIVNVSWISEIARNSGLNQTIKFYFNDTTNDQPVLNLNTVDIILKNNATGTPWTVGDFFLINPSNNGTYFLDVNMGSRNSGWYTLEVNASKFPNYDWSLYYITFYFRGNYTQINMISVSDPEETLTPSGIGNNYTTFLGSDLTIEFNITDIEWYSNVVTQVPDAYFIIFKNLKTGMTGTLQHSLSFVPLAPYSHTGDIISSALTDTGFYIINITVVMLNYENTTFSFNLTLVNSQINIILLSNQGGQLEPSGVGNYYNSTVALDLILDFNITDTESLNKAIARDATVYLVKYINLGTGENGTILNSLAFNSSTSKYSGTLTISGLGVGNYLINVSVVILNYKIIPLTFNLTIVYANSNIVSITNLGGQLPVISNFYDTFIGGNIGIEFNISDVHFETIVLIGAGISYSIYYQNIDTLESGTLQHTLSEISLHSGSLNISLLPIGNYSFSIIVAKSTNNITSLNFLLRIIEKYETRITITKPESVNAGLPFKIIIKAEFFNGIWLPATGSYINITLYYNSGAGTSQDDSTNSTGEIEIIIPTYSDTIMLNLTIQLRSAYNHQGYTEISDIDIIPIPPSFGFEDILPYLIIAAIAVLTLGGSVAIYRGVIVPKKREKQRILTEVKTIFDDAINLEHILVLYKGTGTCIFFKSYGSEQIDPELIGGFLSAVSSFGKEMATQEALNEISYGDKMLLLADGALIRVALVLGKNASLILRRHLKEFIGIFEKTFNDVLPKWRGQLNHFRNAGIIVDEILNTSIILPHQISYDFSKAKDLKNPHSKEVLKIAQRCCKEAEREFFFVATLLKEVADRTNKDTAEIFMGIKELRDKKILIPIEISAIGEQPVSQQEINLINQKVITLPNLTNEEKQKLVNDLAQLGPIEREAYLSSLTKQQEIVTAPIKTTIGDLSVDNQKAAKKGIKELLKRAKIAQSKKSYIKAVEIYQGAAILASNWELTTEFLKIQETIRKTRIEDLKIKKSKLENEAKSAVKAKKYLEAATKYKYASKMASEIFKLGVTEMTKEVKRLTNKTNEYEKMK